jgi:oxaloacetate decarboxylase gamma subunit
MEMNSVFESLKIMMLGMGTVFMFLIVMIIMMNIMSGVIRRFFREPNSRDQNTTPVQENNAKKIAAITAAIMHHKQVSK